jgi:pyruvate formate lyase activating enzyme
MDTMTDAASPEQLAIAAADMDCRSIAFTYNDPIIFMEYALDVATACRERGLLTVGVTAGYIDPEPREIFFKAMDAVNVDLKAFTDSFYYKICGAHLQPVLETLCYIRQETDTWLELTTLLIPGENDSERELNAMTQWAVENLGPDVPMHFTAFHPDWKMRTHASTPLATLQKARRIALDNGVRYAYTGNAYDPEGASTWCTGCGELLIERKRYRLGRWGLDARGCCGNCGLPLPGCFADGPEQAPAHPVRVRMVH